MTSIFSSLSAKQTMHWACRWAKTLDMPAVIALQGDLGSGKTTFIKGMVQAWGIAQETVNSPTFTYMHIYEENQKTSPSSFLPLYHFDLYRIPSLEEFIDLGFEEVLHQHMCVVEWPEIILPLLPPERTVFVQLEYLSLTKRRITIASGKAL